MVLAILIKEADYSLGSSNNLSVYLIQYFMKRNNEDSFDYLFDYNQNELNNRYSLKIPVFHRGELVYVE